MMINDQSMNSKLNEELISRSLQLAALSEMHPDERIARIAWERIQDDLEKTDSMVYGMQFCIANITTLIKTHFKETEDTIAALESCNQLIASLGWNKEEVVTIEQTSKIFVEYIKNAASTYNDVKQEHCENAQCILAINMNSMLLQDLDYLIQKSRQRQRSLTPALDTAAQLRTQMIQIFGWKATEP